MWWYVTLKPSTNEYIRKNTRTTLLATKAFSAVLNIIQSPTPVPEVQLRKFAFSKELFQIPICIRLLKVSKAETY